MIIFILNCKNLLWLFRNMCNFLSKFEKYMSRTTFCFIQVCDSRRFCDEIKSIVTYLKLGWTIFKVVVFQSFVTKYSCQCCRSSLRPHSQGCAGSWGPSGPVLFGCTLYLIGFVVWVNQCPVITPENCDPRIPIITTKSHQPWLSTECSRLWDETDKKKKKSLLAR